MLALFYAFHDSRHLRMEFFSHSESAMFTYLTDELLLKLGEDGSVNETRLVPLVHLVLNLEKYFEN